MFGRSFMVAAAVCLLAPAGAAANPVLDDCSLDEVLTRTYTQAQYRDALDTMPADLRQYTSCEAIIRRAQLAAAQGATAGTPGRGSSGGGSGVLPGLTPSGPSGEETLAKATPEEKRAVAAAAAKAPAPVSLPGAGTLEPAAAASIPSVDVISELPTPLAVTVIGLLLVGALLGVNRMRSRGRPST